MPISLEEINEQLRPILAERAQKAAWLRKQEQLQADWDLQQQRLTRLEHDLSHEFRHFYRLERFPLYRWWSQLMDPDGAHHESERKAYGRVRQQRDEVASQLTRFEQEIRKLRQEVQHLGAIEEVYQELMQLKEKALLQTSNTFAKTLAVYDQRIRSYEASQQQLSNMHSAGDLLRRQVAILIKIFRRLRDQKNQAAYSHTRLGLMSPSFKLQFRRYVRRIHQIESRLASWLERLIQLDDALYDPARKPIQVLKELGPELRRLSQFAGRNTEYFRQSGEKLYEILSTLRFCLEALRQQTDHMSHRKLSLQEARQTWIEDA